ncbi:MAG: bifunctional UDP-N-acetylglucosamine diphosphorylase/glucosamine-1-phosphate N-acetyltransferase GlmU [Thermomicrobium sp.]|nr:bifunctional UDP-N-acetylglucosamine diphosphorylase/glucosamine-1-phosphate N-acetyltransferase GlmU [Thermomicrobium sp.]
MPDQTTTVDEKPDATRTASGEALAVVVLAGGLGTRMRSRTPKELHPLAGRPLIAYVLDAVRTLPAIQRILVVSPAKTGLAELLPPDWELALQEEPLGTGHALAQALPRLRSEVEWVLLVFGDHPLLTAADLERLWATARAVRPLVAVLTTVLPDPAAYGRIQRDAGGRVVGVVEAREDTARYSGPVEVVSGATVYRRAWLERALPQLPRSPSGEYYHTALVALAAAEERSGEAVVTVVAPPESALGVNDRVDLARAEAILRDRIVQAHQRAGVTIVDPATTWIEPEVEIEPDARIEPFTILRGKTRIASGARIGPHAVVQDSVVGPESVVVASVLEESVLGARVHVGPYSHLRPGTVVEDDVHIGNFAELKNARVGRETRIGHVSYVGDAELGERVNIGAGTITCNFDGVAKHRTVIEDDAFIGSDTMLVAPVRVGRGARTGAGSVVTKDVAPGATVVGVPARPIELRRARRDGRTGA